MLHDTKVIIEGFYETMRNAWLFFFLVHSFDAGFCGFF